MSAQAKDRRGGRPEVSAYFEIASGYPGEADGGDGESTVLQRDSETFDRGDTKCGRQTGPIADRSAPQAISWLTPYEADAFHLHNAGLVLVAPFFGRVFKDLDYLADILLMLRRSMLHSAFEPMWAM